MNIALIGYGEMGHALAAAARVRGHATPVIIDRSAPEATAAEVNAKALTGADIAIDFSNPSALDTTVHACMEAAIPLVVGTTVVGVLAAATTWVVAFGLIRWRRARSMMGP